MLLLITWVVAFIQKNCQLFVSCLSVVCQLFSRRVHVAALVPSPLSPLGPKDNRLVKSFSHVTVSDWDHFESVHWQLMFNSWFWQLFFWWYGSNCTCSGSAVTGSSCSGQRWESASLKSGVLLNLKEGIKSWDLSKFILNCLSLLRFFQD